MLQIVTTKRTLLEFAFTIQQRITPVFAPVDLHAKGQAAKQHWH